jgi:hypothetical protein
MATPRQQNRYDVMKASMLLQMLKDILLIHYATNWKIMGSSPDEVNFFNFSNPSSRTMALGSTQPLNRNEYQES